MAARKTTRVIPKTIEQETARADRAEAQLEKLRGHVLALRAGAVARFGKTACRQALENDEHLMALARFAERTDTEAVTTEGSEE